MPALWLARRAAGRTVVHPLWFLIDAGAAARTRHGPARRARLLLVAAIALIALAAAGPVRSARDGVRVLVVDLSATRGRDVDAVRARLAGFDEVVLAAPGVPPRRLPARAAADAIVPGRGTVDAAGLIEATAAALPGARVVAVASAPPIGDDAAIVHARFHREPLAPRRGRIVVAVARHGAVAAPAAIVAHGAAGLLGRAPLIAVGDELIAVLPYAGDGDEAVSVALEPAGADELPDDDTATIEVPALVPARVWIDPALAHTPVARALAVLPTVARVDAPAADVIAVVRSTAWRGPARARLVVADAADGAPAPLQAVPGAPLPGATPALLDATPPVAVDAGASFAIDPAQVWLRAGAHAALGLERDASPPTLRLAVALDGPLLPVVLADALAAPPFAASGRADVPDVRAPAIAPAVPAIPARRGAGRCAACSRSPRCWSRSRRRSPGHAGARCSRGSRSSPRSARPRGTRSAPAVAASSSSSTSRRASRRPRRPRAPRSPVAPRRWTTTISPR